MTMMEMTYGSKPSTPVKKYATPSHLYCFTVPSNSHVKCNFDLCAASALLSVSPQEGCHHSHQCSHQGPQGWSLSSGAHHQAADCKTDPIYCTPWQEASYCQQKGEEE